MRFSEERFCSIGPLGWLGRERPYPEASRPTPNEDRYPASTTPSEERFERNAPALPRRGPRRPEPIPPGVQP